MGATAIVLSIAAQTADAVRGIGQVSSELEKTEKSGGKMSAGLKKAMVPAAAAFTAVTGAAMGFASAAIEDAQGAERMAQNLKKSTGATDEQVASLEDWISAQGAAYGVADDKLRPAMERLGRSYGDVGEAQEAATLAMDISAATGKDLETVSKALAKANDGQMGGLKSLGITLGDQAQNTIEYNKAQKELAKNQTAAQDALEEFGPSSKEYTSAMGKVEDSQKAVNTLAAEGVDWMGELGEEFGGAASSNANTAAGKMERFQLALAETGESIGAALLPAIEALMGPLMSMATWAQNNSTFLTILLGVIGTIAGVVLVANAALAAWSTITAIWSAVTAIATAVGTAFGAVMAFITSPVFLVIAAIVALIAIGILLYKNWDKIKAWLLSAWNAIKDAATSIWNGLKNWLSTTWDTIKTKAIEAFNALKSKVSEIWNNIKTAVEDKIKGLIQMVKDLPSDIVKALGNLTNTLYSKGRDLIQGLIDGMKSLLGSIGSKILDSLPGWLKKVIPGVSSSSASMSSLSASPAAMSATINVNAQTAGLPNTPRALIAMLDTHNTRMGRRPGTTRALSW